MDSKPANRPGVHRVRNMTYKHGQYTVKNVVFNRTMMKIQQGVDPRGDGIIQGYIG